MKEVDSFLIVYKYKDRFTRPFKRTLTMITKMFGNFWTNVVLVVKFLLPLSLKSFYSYSCLNFFRSISGHLRRHMKKNVVTEVLPCQCTRTS